MNDVFDFRLNCKEIITAFLILLVLLVGSGFAGYLLGVERAADVHNNGGGASGIGQQIGEAGTAIGNAEAGIGAAAGTADQIGAGLGAAQESAQYIHSTAATSAELIAECQSILAGIRSRGEKDPAAH